MNTAHEEQLQQAREIPRGIEGAHKALRFDGFARPHRRHVPQLGVTEVDPALSQQHPRAVGSPAP